MNNKDKINLNILALELYCKAIGALKVIKKLSTIQSNYDTVDIIINRLTEMSIKQSQPSDFLTLKNNPEINKPCNCDECKKEIKCKTCNGAGMVYANDIESGLHKIKCPNCNNPKTPCFANITINEISKFKNPKTVILQNTVFCNFKNSKIIKSLKLYPETLELINFCVQNISSQTASNLEALLYDYTLLHAVNHDLKIDSTSPNYNATLALIKDNIQYIDSTYSFNNPFINILSESDRERFMTRINQ